MQRLSALRRHISRVARSAWKARESAETPGTGMRSRVPGRHEAIEATLNPLRTAAPSTLTILGFSLLAAAALSWYYAHAYAHAHLPVGDRAPHAAEPADNPLPPLPHVEPPRVVSARPDAHAYVIGDILNADNGMARQDAAVNAQGAPAAEAAYSDTLTNVPSAQRPQIRRLDGAVFTRTMGPADGASPIHADADWKPANLTASVGAEQSSVARLLRAEVTPSIAASVLPTQRLLLPKGAFLDCTLETAIDSTLPGLTTCITAFDTFSADGTVVLLERGTKLIGEMRSQVQQGTARVFVLWTEARTPKGIVVALASPGTDELGRSGLPGIVDRHFADRFGAAILVSMINGAIQSAVNHSQQNGGTVILNPSGAGDVATEVLRSTLNIPPTVRIAQGERIQVLVARDLDFRSVYTLHAR